MVAGGLVLVAAIIGLYVVARTTAARRAWAGTLDVVTELRAPAQETIGATVPATLQPEVGTLVYLDRADGVAQVVGRVVAVDAGPDKFVRLRIRLMGPLAEQAQRGGILKGAPATLDLRSAVQLLISPNTPDDEAALARDIIWPSVRSHVLPAMTEGLVREIANELATLDEQDQALLSKSLQAFRKELKPLEDQLIDRLAKRAWDVIGVKGLAAGIWRTTTSSAQNQGVAVADWWWQLFGTKPGVESSRQPFLSPETSEALQAALKDETLAFWKENRQAIVAALAKVANERRGDFEAAFAERWAGKLYDRAVLPAWRGGQDKVLQSVQIYANDFAARRLLTKQGGPRLLFAYALRSSLKISYEPLLIFSPADNPAGKIVYEPLLR